MYTKCNANIYLNLTYNYNIDLKNYYEYFIWTEHIAHKTLYVIELLKYVLALTIWKLKWLNCVFIGSTIFTMKCVNWMECWCMKIYLISFRHTMKLWHSYTIYIDEFNSVRNEWFNRSFVNLNVVVVVGFFFRLLNIGLFCNG